MTAARTTGSWSPRSRASGDEAAFRTLYRRHTPALYRLALRLGGGDEPWAEELVQRAWIRAVEGLGGFGWRSTLSDLARRHRRQLRPGALARGAPRRRPGRRRSARRARGAALVAAGHEDRIDLERAIERLPAGYRQVFVLHDVEGYTHEEIGGLLGIEAGTSKSQLSHARRRLRASLDPPASADGAEGQRMMRSDDELTPDERDALGPAPARRGSRRPGLEQATVAALAARGLLRRPRRRLEWHAGARRLGAAPRRPAWPSAGSAAGPARRRRPTAGPGSRSFLYEGADYRPAAAEAREPTGCGSTWRGRERSAPRARSKAERSSRMGTMSRSRPTAPPRSRRRVAGDVTAGGILPDPRRRSAGGGADRAELPPS